MPRLKQALHPETQRRADALGARLKAAEQGQDAEFAHWLTYVNEDANDDVNGN